MLHEPQKTRLRRWAANNAEMLVFLTVMFAISWILTIVLALTIEKPY